MIGATSIAWPAVYLAEAAVEQIYGSGRLPTAASSVMPAGPAVPVEGGYRLSGQWFFASGIRHAEWVVAGALVASAEETPPRRIMAVIPASAVQIHDNWQVAGLKGTGSCAFSVAGLFVPTAFAWTVG